MSKAVVAGFIALWGDLQSLEVPPYSSAFRPGRPYEAAEMARAKRCIRVGAIPQASMVPRLNRATQRSRIAFLHYAAREARRNPGFPSCPAVSHLKRRRCRPYTHPSSISFRKFVGLSYFRHPSFDLGPCLNEEVEMDDPVRHAGREAARCGVPISACPFMKADNMPGHTGEPVKVWNAKMAAWEAGWNEVTDARIAALRRRRGQLLAD